MDALDGVLEASPDAVLVVDEAGVIQQANRNVQTVLGHAPEELEGSVVEDLLPPEDREHHVRFRREYMEAPEPRPMGRELDLYALHEDGTNVPVEISLGPIERDGERYVVATISDVTNRKRRERELQRKNERLDEFASIVSHDLRNPLNVAQGSVELAREECDTDHLDAAVAAHDRMEELIADLLTLSREGRRERELESVDLAAVADRCRHNVETGEATLAIEAEQSIRTDPGQLQQLLENLIVNAVEHGSTNHPSHTRENAVERGDEDEDVTVTVGDLAGGFYVADDGPGIPAEERERVFEPGYSTAEDGTGFGLNIVREVAEAHGWEITIAESDSGGARFEITGVDVTA